MQERHVNRSRYFNEQSITTEKYVIPYIEEVKTICCRMNVLEIGCGEGGNLVPFIKRNCKVTGIDLSEKKIDNAKIFLKEFMDDDKDIELFLEDIYEHDFSEEYDIIIMRDVIEHIPEQSKLMKFIKSILKDDGLVFIAFPPWHNPFGGHQQICNNKILSHLPYYHILPVPLYKALLKAGKEPSDKIESLLEIKETGISINRFLSILKSEDYRIKKLDYYFINPNYEVKFGLTPRLQTGLVASIPFLRDFLTTSVYAIISKKSEK